MKSTVTFADDSIKDAFLQLQYGTKEEREVFKQIKKVLEKLKENAFAGIQIPKRLIPKEYDVPNLWKINLPRGWRLLYFIVSDEVIILSIILEWMSHKKYERRFKY
jgi:Txe/YoeB family toxin of Txe-Axe toxin-antitoxin module